MLNVLSVAVQVGVPVLLWSAPGAGKSSVIRQLGEPPGHPVEVVIAAIREPSDFAGLPVVVDGEVRFAPPASAQRLANAGHGLLFLDEISTAPLDEISAAPPAVQAASFCSWSSAWSAAWNFWPACLWERQLTRQNSASADGSSVRHWSNGFCISSGGRRRGHGVRGCSRARSCGSRRSSRRAAKPNCQRHTRL